MLIIRCDEDWNKEISAGIRITIQDDEQYFIMQVPYEGLNKSVKACEKEMIRQMEMMFSGEYIFDGTGIYKRSKIYWEGQVVMCKNCDKELTTGMEVEYSERTNEYFCSPNCARDRYFDYMLSRPIDFEMEHNNLPDGCKIK